MSIVLGALIVYLVALATIAFGQRRLMYFPFGREEAPASVGLPRAEILHLDAADGERLLAWYVPPAPGQPLILYFHGNANGIADRAERFHTLTAAGNGLLAVEYRGYPGSTGSPSEKGLLIDGETGYSKALALGVPPARIVVMGESLGSGVAVDVASRHEIGALVLDSPFTSTADVAAYYYWMFPVRLLMRDQYRSDEKIGKVRAPVLIVHGANDLVVPYRFGKKLFALANEPKDFIRIEGAGHLALGAALPQALAWIEAKVGRR
jgi:fermentation-respiration switch protein FrsA (DUF1100 family)